MRKIAYASAYVGATNEPAIRLAEKIVRHAYPNSSAVYYTTGGAESNESRLQDRALFLEGPGQAGQDQDHLAHPRLSRRHDGGDERHRHGRLPQDVRPAGAGLPPGRAALSLSLAGQRGVRASAPPRRSRRRSWREGPDTVAGGHRRAGDGRRRRHRAARQLFPETARDLRPIRRAADRRRGDHRLRPHRALVRARPLGRRARHRLVRQGRDQRLSAAGRHHPVEAGARRDPRRAARPPLHARRDL